MNKVRKIHREEIAYDLRTIYTSVNKKGAEMRLKILLNKWKKLYPRVFLSSEKEFKFFITSPQQIQLKELLKKSKEDSK